MRWNWLFYELKHTFHVDDEFVISSHDKINLQLRYNTDVDVCNLYSANCYYSLFKIFVLTELLYCDVLVILRNLQNIHSASSLEISCHNIHYFVALVFNKLLNLSFHHSLKSFSHKFHYLGHFNLWFKHKTPLLWNSVNLCIWWEMRQI